MIRNLYTLWALKRRVGLSWAEALREGIQGLQRYAALDRRYEQQRDAEALVSDALHGPGAPLDTSAEPVVSVHDY